MVATSSSKSLDTVPLLIAGLCPLLPRPEQTQFRWVCSGHPPSPPFQSSSKHTDKFPLHVVGGIGNQYRQNLSQLITEVWHHFGVPVDTVDSQPPGHVPLELSRRHAAYYFYDLVTEDSWQFFDIVKVAPNFLALPPSKWADNEDYMTAREYVRTLKVTWNDIIFYSIFITVERGEKLASDYIKVLTTSTAMREKVFQVVEDIRR